MLYPLEKCIQRQHILILDDQAQRNVCMQKLCKNYMDPFIQQRGQKWRSKDQHTTKVLLEIKQG